MSRTLQEDETSTSNIENEIAELESRLQAAKHRLAFQSTNRPPSPRPIPPPTTTLAHHHLLLLSDSALPLGSFAFSSGLESYLAHTRPYSAFHTFLPLSLDAYASTTLPFVLAAYRGSHGPEQQLCDRLAELDDTLDASIICVVGRRASIAQGRALLSIWERSLCKDLPSSSRTALSQFAKLVRASSSTSASALEVEDTGAPAEISAHLPPLFGAVAALLGLTAQQTAYVFLLGHAKAVVSAGVRAGVMGPYQAQKILAGQRMREMLEGLVDREWGRDVWEAGQCVPVLEVLAGRHEVLYSRIFNS